MKKLFYYFIKYTIRIITNCYFRKIRIYGLDNIPKNGGILFSPNHQSAFMDPLLIGCNIDRPVTSLTRGDIFGGPMQWFMDALMMLPVYRIRNGYANLKKNEAIFNRCKNLLSNNQSIMMFSEAGHHDEFFLQPLSKGSSRLAYETQENCDNQIYIVPVGINYGHHRNPLCDLHIVFGEAIMIKPFIDEDGKKPKQINAIRDSLELNMKKCLWLPEKDEHYEIRKKLIHRGNTKKSFQEMKKGVEEKTLPQKKRIEKYKWHKLIIGLFSIPNLPPLIILKKILGLFKDLVFYSSIKMSVGLILFVFWWASIFLCVSMLYSWKIGLIITLGCIIFLYIKQLLSIKYLQ
ncbi:MAG: lysophospholipid acyltransferase family protein [Flavobacteriaceae bacterium]